METVLTPRFVANCLAIFQPGINSVRMEIFAPDLHPILKFFTTGEFNQLGTCGSSFGGGVGSDNCQRLSSVVEQITDGI